MSSWPIHAWTWTIEAWLMASEPKVWRRSWKRSGRSPAASRRALVAAAQRRVVERLALWRAEHEDVAASVAVALGEPGQRLRGRVDQRHRAAMPALGRDQVPARVLLHRPDGAVFEVRVVPAQPQALPAVDGGGRSAQGTVRPALWVMALRQRVDLGALVVAGLGVEELDLVEHDLVLGPLPAHRWCRSGVGRHGRTTPPVCS